MKHRQSFAPCIPVLAAALLVARMCGAASVGVWPTLATEGLNERPLNLPGALPGEVTLVLVGYSREQQKQIDTWIAGLGTRLDHMPWLEVAVVDPSNAFVRGMIGSAMRREIADPQRRDHVVIAYSAPDKLAGGIGCRDFLHSMCAAIVERTGVVRRAVSGPYSGPAASDLLKAWSAGAQSEAKEP